MPTMEKDMDALNFQVLFHVHYVAKLLCVLFGYLPKTRDDGP